MVSNIIRPVIKVETQIWVHSKNPTYSLITLQCTGMIQGEFKYCPDSRSINNLTGIQWNPIYCFAALIRQYSCFILFSLRCVIVMSSATCFFNNIMFRYLQVMYAGRGLVVQGTINTGMMGALYLLWDFSLCSMLMLSSIGMHYIYFDQPQNFIMGRVCNRIHLDYSSDKEGKEYHTYFEKPLFVMTFYAVVPLSFVVYFKIKMKRYLRSVCPNGKSSALGGNHKRNLLTFDDNIRSSYFNL